MQQGQYRGTRGGYRGGRGGRRGGATSPPKGLFEGGNWKCDCKPRLVAEHFKVKKEGPNTGRWFYTCQKNEKERCGFFLWDEQARMRMQAAVMSNSRDEPRQSSDVQEGWDAGRGARQGSGMFAGLSSQPPHIVQEDTLSSPSPSPIPAAATTPAESSKKRNASDAQLDDDEESSPPWTLTGEEEAELAMAASTLIPKTPHKAQKMGVYATPTTTGRRSPRKLPWIVEPVTPSTTKKTKTVADYFTSPTKQVKFALPDETHTDSDEAPETPQAPPTLADPLSPSPVARFRDALVNPSDSASSLTSEVLAELSSIQLPPETLSNLRSILTRHDLKSQGVTKGRDLSRLALRAGKSKVVELEAKIASLEAERERDRAMIARLQWKRENHQDDDDESQL